MIKSDSTTFWPPAGTASPRVALIDLDNFGTDDDVESCFEQLEEVYDRQQKFCVIIKLGENISVTAAQRVEVNRRFAALDLKAKDIQICAAVLLKSPVVRGFMSALHWIKPPATPQKFFRHLSDCIPWINEHLSTHYKDPLSPEDVERIAKFFREFASSEQHE